jgi:hypothetical protein
MIFSQKTSAFGWARGFAAGKVCTVHAPFGLFSGNVCHSNWRFGFYLDNSMPRNLARTVGSNGMLTDYASCDEFLPDGTDNGAIGVVEDELDYLSDFVGCYELGDIQMLRYTASNNLKGWYWKHTKNFNDGGAGTPHIKDSEFNWFTDLGVGAPGSGNAHIMGPGGVGAFIIENTVFTG